MKRHGLLKIMCGLLLAIGVSAGLTSCGSDDWWWNGPPSGWVNTINDSRLNGYWRLYQYNGELVYPGEENYLYFNGDGFGLYYYWDNGMRYTEQIRYYCQPSVSGSSNYQINIQYEYGNPATENYWFPSGPNRLWMQWQTGSGRVVTYVYERIGGAPW